MKQSKKLLSIILAMLMAFSAVSVVASAGLGTDKSAVSYDSVDDAVLSAEQVADLALDAVDKLLVEADIYMDLSILGKINLRSVDSALSSIYDIINSNGIILWMAGDLGDISVSALKNVQRSGGDLNVIYALLQFLKDNESVISKVAYGLKTDNGIGFGIANSFIDLGSVESILGDIPTYLTKTVASLLLYGSYDYSDESYSSADTITLNSSIDNLDKILNVAVYNLLTDPQDYEYSGTGDSKVKVWDESSRITTADKVSTADVNLNSNSILGILDNIIDVAFADYGVPGLNNEIKRLLMEATGVDFVRITDANTINMVKAAPGYVDTATADAATVATVKNFAFDSQMLKIGGTWYLRTNGYEDVLDASGEKTYDEEGNVVREKIDKFWRANTANVNAFYNVVNWDYSFAASDLDFAALVSEYGSIFGSLNHILSVILNKAVNADFVNPTTLWEDGTNAAKLNNNILNTAKWVVKTFTKDLFGKTSEYVDANGNATAAFVADVDACTTIESIVAYIGLPFMNDAMPQLIMPEFDEGKQIEELGAIAIREFVTDIAPNVNYDDVIFKAGTLTSASGREFASHTSDEWINILLNMGMDIAYTYLNNLTNFNTAIPSKSAVTTEADWTAQLDAVIMWAVNYIGEGSSSVLAGFDPTTIASKEGPFAKLTYIINTLLPLGLVSGRSVNDNGELDVRALFDQAKNVITNLDFADLLTVFGRDHTTNNLLLSNNVVASVLGLVQRILALVAGTNLLPNTASCAGLLTQANLKTLISSLLNALNTRKAPLVSNALPIVAKFVKDWGGEQILGSPELELANNVATTNGATTGYSVKVKNGSKGVWRGYDTDKDGTYAQDNQYDYEVLSIVSSDSAVNTISTGANGKLSYGAEKSFTFNATVPAGGKVLRFDVTYQVYDEEGNLMANGKQFVTSKYVYVSYNPSNDGEKTEVSKSSLTSYALKYIFVAGESISSLANNTAISSKRSAAAVGSKELKWTPSGTTTQNGITVKQVSQGSAYNITSDTYLNLCPFTVDVASFVLPKDGAVYTFNGTLYAIKQTADAPIKIYVYSDASKRLLDGVVDSEVGKLRTANDYNTSNCFAQAVLNANATTDELKQETNFTATGVNAEGETVTVINGEQAWATYVDAFNAAVRASYQPNYAQDYVTDFYSRYEALRVAASDLDYCKKSAEQLKAEGAESIDTDVATLKTTLASVRANEIQDRSYTDYMMYRWNRYTEWQNKAGDLISLAKAASLAVADDQYFPYSGISETDLRALVENNANKDYILALLKNYSESEIEQNADNLENTKNNYAGYDSLDVAQISNMLNRTAYRLILRDGSPVKTYINAEIASAQNQIGTVQGNYTDRSWARYSKALANAITAAAGIAQSRMFDAKYELQVARNELKVEAEEADYTELEALMSQAEGVLANASLYNNTAADFGKVLAALGMDAITNADGDEVQLFPNSAKIVDTKSYEDGDQRKVDAASDALKAALADMRFISTTGTEAGKAPVTTNQGASLEDNVVLEKDEQGEATVTASVATIAANKTAEQVKALFVAAAQGAGETTLEVSTDSRYANKADDNLAFAGTNSTVTVFTTVSGVKVPVATIKIVVTGDVNGDGVIDVLDASATELVSSEHAALTGCFFRAADADNSSAITPTDYSAVVNLALAG